VEKQILKMGTLTIACTFILCMAAPAIYAQGMKEIKRDSFSLKYPEKWKIDKEDPDYDADALFSIEAPDDENMIMFFVFNTVLDADEMLKEQIKALTESLLKNPEITDFSDWGKYKGKGKLLKGKFLGTLKGYIRLFFYEDDHKSMLVMEQIYDSASDEVRTGLRSIADSFSFKK
jgi:hypothetical protein